MFANLIKEFPDFDVSTLPAIPAGWTDSSWHNDTCPSFNAGNDIYVYIDYADSQSDKREFPENANRFSVLQQITSGFADCTFESNNWQAVLDFISGIGTIEVSPYGGNKPYTPPQAVAAAYAANVETDAKPVTIADKIRLAREFGTEMQGALTTRQFREMCDRNKAESSDLVCHSHDYCDANMYMLEAFKTTFGREPAFLESPDSAAGDMDMTIWNDAWSIAKAADFFA